MRPIHVVLSALIACLVAWGCGGESEMTATDTDMSSTSGLADAAEADAGGADPVSLDAGSEDADTGGADPVSLDSGSEDADPMDPEAVDTAVEDTPGGDPPSADAEALDTAVDDVAGGDPPAADAEGQDAGPTEDVTASDPVSFATVFNEVLEPMGCTAGYCHAGHAGGMLMDSLESAYDNLVNVEASTPTDCDATMRVVPGDPDASMLWIRVRPQADDCLDADQKMPLFGVEALTDEQLDLIHDWILTGANP
jgi:hypothetical protein